MRSQFSRVIEHQKVVSLTKHGAKISIISGLSKRNYKKKFENMKDYGNPQNDQGVWDKRIKTQKDGFAG